MLMILFNFCNDNVGIIDQTYEFRGYVKSSSQNFLEADALIGFKNPKTPDSLIFHGDSINTSIEYGILGIQKTNTQGYFQFDFFLGNRDTAMYKYLFAYKKGFHLWKYVKNTAKVKEVNNLIDEIVITLEESNN